MRHDAPARRGLRVALGTLVLALVTAASMPLSFGPAPEAVRSQLSGLPGVGVVVATLEGDRSDVRAYGAPLEGESRFEIGSVTKTFTGALLADMVHRGEVAPDDPIERYLPPGALAPTYAGRHITLLDLATQSSGLPRMPTNFAPQDVRSPYADYGETRLLAFLASYALTRAPGSKFEYSNLGYGLLGYLLARRLHEDYAIAIRTRIFEPLGMTHSFVESGTSAVPQTVGGHDSDGDPVPDWRQDALAGAGAVISTPSDMLRYARANLDGATGPLAGALCLARTPVREAELGMRIGFAWLTRPDGIQWLNGGTAGFRTFLGIDQTKRRAIVVLANGFIDAVDGLGLHALDPAVALPPAPPLDVAVDVKTLDGYAGRYRFADASTCTVSRDERGLIANFDTPAFRARLHAESRARFTIRSPLVTVEFAGTDGERTMTVAQPRQPTQTAKRL